MQGSIRARNRPEAGVVAPPDLFCGPQDSREENRRDVGRADPRPPA
jgi:hypothetical protein